LTEEQEYHCGVFEWMQIIIVGYFTKMLKHAPYDEKTGF
jgi:hypothetical protein